MGEDDWKENSKFILKSIQTLCDKQEIIFDKIADLHAVFSSGHENMISDCATRQEKINERFVSKWLLNVLITILISVFITCLFRFIFSPTAFE